MKYVAGFLFNDAGTEVALIQKRKGPPAVVGKWNAIGGKIEAGETAEAAMEREFLEEAGVSVAWEKFLILGRGMDWTVEFFHAFSTEALALAHTCEEEMVAKFRVGDIPNIIPGVVPNLNWIIPMALGHFRDNVEVYRVQEWITGQGGIGTPMTAQDLQNREALLEPLSYIEIRKTICCNAGERTPDRYMAADMTRVELGVEPPVAWADSAVEALAGLIAK